MDRETFTKQLGAFKRHLSSTMKLARELAEASIDHFHEHGDLSYTQELYDTMGKNFVRRDAFTKWMVSFSPSMLVEGKWKKDKSEEANKFNIAAAKKLPFWEFAPAKDISDFSAEDLFGAVLKFVSKYENGKKYSPHDETARVAVERIKDAVTAIVKDTERKAETLDQPAEAQANPVAEAVAEAA